MQLFVYQFNLIERLTTFQSCRFKKCLQIGMTSDAVQSKPVKAVAENDGSLSFLLKCRKSNFSVRAQETLKTYNGVRFLI